MSYSDFSLNQLKEQFGIELIEDAVLFPDPELFPISDLLALWIERFVSLATLINTEKARSELIIAPILADLKWRLRDQVSLFSGVDFTVDTKEGLNGRCDFIISKNREQLVISAPVIMLVEAKNENIIGGIPQCIAEMIAAQRFNKARHNSITVIYGVVTTGSLWRFLKLDEVSRVFIDPLEYPIQNLSQIMGILEEIVKG
jgi:hypothetical protein